MEFIDLNNQIRNLDSDLKSIYSANDLDSHNPVDIARAILLAEEREIDLKLSSHQRIISKDAVYNLRIIRRGEERKIYLAGGESPLTPPPKVNRKPTHRRQTKDQWCYATTALMLAEDSGYIKPIHVEGIKRHTPTMYTNDPKLRYKYCGYDVKEHKYYCDSGQEYTVILVGDSQFSCIPGSISKAVTALTGKTLLKIGNDTNTYWQDYERSPNHKRIKFLADNLKVPAVFDGLIDGDPVTQKGHSFLIKDFAFDGTEIKLFTEECVYGETPIITNLISYIDCSVYEYKIKITNIYYFE
jgi:hypothetical protein